MVMPKAAFLTWFFSGFPCLVKNNKICQMNLKLFKIGVWFLNEMSSFSSILIRLIKLIN